MPFPKVRLAGSFVLFCLCWWTLELRAESDPAYFSAVNKAVSGDDNRVDLDHAGVTDAQRLAARSVAMLVSDRNVLEQQSSQSVLLLGDPLGKKLSLCPNQPFAQQLSIGYCSGFLAAPDLLVTAGHCVKSSVDCGNTSIVFDYDRSPEIRINSIEVPQGNVYHCANLVASKIDRTLGIDFSVIRLDRPVTDRAPLPIYREAPKVNSNEKLAMIGHPSGLPTKLNGGTVTEARPGSEYFTTNLASFVGSSGSPVFDASMGVVEGILVRGDRDYLLQNSCYVVNHCQDLHCNGSDVLRTQDFAPVIPKIGSALEVIQSAVEETEGVPEGTADPGETLRLAFFLRNVGTASVSSGKAKLSTTTAGVHVIQDQTILPKIDVGEIAEIRDFVISLDKELSCQKTVQLELNLQSEENAPLVIKTNLPLGHEEYRTFSLDSPGTAIPDNSPAGLKATAHIDEDPAGRPVRVVIKASHPDISQLTLSVRSPDGKEAELFKHAIPADGRITPVPRVRISGVYGRDLQPYQSIAGLSQVFTAGDWSVTATDDSPGAKGQLSYAGIAFVDRVCATPGTHNARRSFSTPRRGD